MGAESILHAAAIYDNLNSLVDDSHAGEADCFEWAMGRVAPSEDRIWQNLAISASLHTALALALVLAPFSTINTKTQIFQVQLVSIGSDGDLSPFGGGAPGGPLAASEAGTTEETGKAFAGPSENAKANASGTARLIEEKNEPVEGESTPPIPDEKPVPPDQMRAPVSVNALDSIKQTSSAKVRPLSAAKSNVQKAAASGAKTRSEADSRLPADPSCPLGDSQLQNQDQGKSPSVGAGDGEGSGAQAGHGSGGSSGNGPFEAQFGSPNGPRFLHKAIPSYPHQARQMQKEGTVILHVTIDESGRAVEIELVKRAGCGFDEEATKAVRNSTFAPARKEGKPIVCKAVLPIRFVLKNAEDY
jgi:protein TonB